MLTKKGVKTEDHKKRTITKCYNVKEVAEDIFV